MDNAFEWVEEHGICSEEDYKYTSGGGTRGRCHTPACQPGVSITGFIDVPSKDEDALKAAVAGQPVSVAIEADKMVFQMYKGGVLDSDKCGQNLDHGVLLVGYGTDGGVDYWKVKNSWGTTWGEDGYIRMSRGHNTCGIASQASYATGAKAAPPGPAPGPSPPPPPAGTHYGDPSQGCLPDEQAVSVQGFDGDFCSPECTDSDCPSDVPAKVHAHPACVLQGEHSKNCALTCLWNWQCGPMSCEHQENGIGLCTYAAGAGHVAGLSLGLAEQVEIVV